MKFVKKSAQEPILRGPGSVKLTLKLLLLTLLIPLTLVTNETLVSAQREVNNVIADGEYRGTHAVGGAVYLPMPEGTGNERFLWSGCLKGDVEFASVLGAIDGDWSLEGDAVVVGKLGELILEGTQFTQGGGTIEGRASIDPSTSGPGVDISLNGKTQTSTSITGTLDSARIIPSQTSEQSDSSDISVQLEEVSVTCNMLQGTWIQQVEQTLEQAGLVPEMAVAFTAYRVSGDHGELFVQQLDRLEALQQEGIEIYIELQLGSFDRERIMTWIADTGAVMSALEKDQNCGIDVETGKFLTPITHLARQIASEISLRGSTADLAPALYLAINTGAMGSGAISSISIEEPGTISSTSQQKIIEQMLVNMVGDEGLNNQILQDQNPLSPNRPTCFTDLPGITLPESPPTLGPPSEEPAKTWQEQVVEDILLGMVGAPPGKSPPREKSWQEELADQILKGMVTAGSADNGSVPLEIIKKAADTVQIIGDEQAKALVREQLQAMAGGE